MMATLIVSLACSATRWRALRARHYIAIGKAANPTVAGLWQERIENLGNRMSRDMKECKTVDFDRGCNSIQNQLLKFYYLA
jgi:hypothetical protein